MAVGEIIECVKTFFTIEELVTPERYAVRGENAFGDFDPLLLQALYLTRKMDIQAFIINNWHKGGQLKNSGLRDNNKVGAKFSGHLVGKCLDIHTADPEALWNLIYKNWHHLGITEIEDKRKTILNVESPWVHISTRWTGLKRLAII